MGRVLFGSSWSEADNGPKIRKMHIYLIEWSSRSAGRAEVEKRRGILSFHSHLFFCDPQLLRPLEWNLLDVPLRLRPSVISLPVGVSPFRGTAWKC